MKLSKRQKRELRELAAPIESVLGALTSLVADYQEAQKSPDERLASTGADGYRAAFIIDLAHRALYIHKTPEGAALEFLRKVTWEGFVADLEETLPDFATPLPIPIPSLVPKPPTLEGLIPTPRWETPKGRPPGRTVEVHVRVWTVECLRKLAGIKSVEEALRLWNRWFPEHAINEITIPSTGRRTFHRDLNAVAKELKQYEEAARPQPRKRGRPKKDLFPFNIGDLLGGKS